MRSTRLLGAVTAALVLSLPSPAHTAVAPTPPARGEVAGDVVMRFTFEGKSGLGAGAHAKNVAGKGRGVVLVTEGARLRKVRGRPGRAALFPQPGTGFGIIEAADRRAWDPRRRAFSFGAKVRMTEAQGRGDSNIVQKGTYSQPGGQWKLQSDHGIPSCVVNGSEGRVLVRSATSIADGAWHGLACRRTARRLNLLVDGDVVASVAGETGRVSNDSAVRLGGKRLGPGNVDQFRGRLDGVFLSMG